MPQNDSNEVIYFVKILAGICVLGLIVNLIFNKASFIAMCIIFSSMLGLLLVQFDLSIRGSMNNNNNNKSFLGIIKKLFHFRNLILMLILTGWVFDIYLNNYNDIENKKMPPMFYSISNAYMWVIVCQVIMVVGNFIRSKKQLNNEIKQESSDVFSKMSKLYNAQYSSLNAILNVVNLIMVIILYVISEMFVTDG